MFIPTCIIILALFISGAVTYYLSHPDAKFRVLDYPNARSLHDTPISRLGGLAIVPTIVFFTLIFSYLSNIERQTIIFIITGCSIIAFISFIDDNYSLHPIVRILIHFFAAILVLYQVFANYLQIFPGINLVLPDIFIIILSLVFLVWMTNLYNFMDGMDGFSGGMAVIGFTAMGILGWQANSDLFVFINLLIAGASAGFLIFNFPPAKIFMGDMGSSTLGYLVGALALWASRDKLFPFWAAILIFSPFIVDATVTLIRRIIKREVVWEAHKTHYYQRLVQLGWGHRKTVLWEYVLMLLSAGSALLAVQLQQVYQWIIILTWIAIYTILIFYVAHLERFKR